MPVTDNIDSLTIARHPEGWTDLDTRAVDTVRVLAADAVQKVGNGHPGTAMSLAPLAYTLFQRVLRHDPSDQDWLGRDRFVLSCGHSSLTQYYCCSMLPSSVKRRPGAVMLSCSSRVPQPFCGRSMQSAPTTSRASEGRWAANPSRAK